MLSRACCRCRVVKDGRYPKRDGPLSQIENSTWATNCIIRGPKYGLEGDKLVRQNRDHRDTFDVIGQKWLLSRVLIYIYDDGCFAIGSAACL